MRSRLGAGAKWVVALAVAVMAGLLLLGVQVHSAQQDRETAAERRFALRAQVSAGLTESFFDAIGRMSQEALVRRFGGSAGDVRRALDRQARDIARREGAQRPLYSAVVDTRGNVIASRGSLPAGIAARAVTQPTLSDIRRTPRGEVIDYAVPFSAPDGPRQLIQGMRARVLREFLTALVSGAPNPERNAIAVVDGKGTVLARIGTDRIARAKDRISASARLPGTTWSLRLVGDREVVMAPAGSAWLHWAMFGFLALVLLAAIWLLARLLVSSHRERGAHVALRESEGKLRALVEALEEAVVVKHADGGVDLLNASAKRLVEAGGAALWRGSSGGWTLIGHDGAEIAVGDAPIERALRTGHPQRQVIGVESTEGGRSFFELRARPLARPDEPLPYAVVCSSTDVTQRQELEAHLMDLADRDPLTGLWNRRRFERDLELQLERCRRYGEQAGLLVIDIDGFKEINDTLGHLAGDDVLRALADVLATRLRASDCAARLGGDEFAALMINVSEAEVRRIADDVTFRLEEAGRAVQDRLPFSISIGTTRLDATTSSTIEALGAADAAMYASKRHAAEPVAQAQLPALRALRHLSGADVAWLARPASDGRQIDTVVSGEDSLGLAIGDRLPADGKPDGVESFARVPIVDPDGGEHGELCVARRDGDLSFGRRERAIARALGRFTATHLPDMPMEGAEGDVASVKALLTALESHDGYGPVHSRKVVSLSRAVAQQLDLDALRVVEVEFVALLRDIGKLAVPNATLQKDGPLTREEEQLIRTHPLIGAEIAAATAELAHLAPAVRAAHERWDGTGYPDGLSGEEIPIASRITAACAAYRTMTTRRPYRAAMSGAEARAELLKLSGVQFCPQTTHALLAVIDSLFPTVVGVH